jgi:hypothetical protein
MRLVTLVLMTALPVLWVGSTAADDVIPGFALPELRTSLEKAGFTCVRSGTATPPPLWDCARQTPGGDFRVSVYGPAPSSVTRILAEILTRDRGLARGFLAAIATTPYRGAKPEKARAWVERSVKPGMRRSRFGPAAFAVWDTSIYPRSKLWALEIAGARGPRKPARP